jgi:hypothetical protein
MNSIENYSNFLVWAEIWTKISKSIETKIYSKEFFKIL